MVFELFELLYLCYCCNRWIIRRSLHYAGLPRVQLRYSSRADEVLQLPANYSVVLGAGPSNDPQASKESSTAYAANACAVFCPGREAGIRALHPPREQDDMIHMRARQPLRAPTDLLHADEYNYT